MSVIEAKHYQQARAKLVTAKDGIVINMALDLAAGIKAGKVSLEQFVHDDGGPRFEFMMAANRAYDKAGGSDHAHIGAVAEAVLGMVTYLTVPGTPLPFGLDKIDSKGGAR